MAAIKLAFAIDRGNGSEVVVVKPYAICEFEMENRVPLGKLLERGVGLSDMTDLVYRQLKADGYSQTLDEFRRSLEDITAVDAEDPTVRVEEA